MFLTCHFSGTKNGRFFFGSPTQHGGRGRGRGSCRRDSKRPTIQQDGKICFQNGQNLRKKTDFARMWTRRIGFECRLVEILGFGFYIRIFASRRPEHGYLASYEGLRFCIFFIFFPYFSPYFSLFGPLKGPPLEGCLKGCLKDVWNTFEGGLKEVNSITVKGYLEWPWIGRS